MAEAISSVHPDHISHVFLVNDIVSSLFYLFAAICVVLRFVQRHSQSQVKTGWDDWTNLGAFLFATCVYICDILLSLPNIGGGGYDTSKFIYNQLHRYRILSDLADSFYTTSVALSKTSILLFYRRIFSIDRAFLIIMCILLAIIFIAWFVAIFFIAYYPSSGVRGVTGGLLAAILGSIIVDLAILSMLQFKVWRLGLTLQRKILLSILIVLGSFSIVASILRLVTLEHLKAATYDEGLGTVYLWANVEMFLYIICACLPIMYNIVRIRVKKQVKRISRPKFTDEQALVTIGQVSTRGDWSNFSSKTSQTTRNGRLQGAGYNVVCQLSNDKERIEMDSLDPVHIRSDWTVTRED